MEKRKGLSLFFAFFMLAFYFFIVMFAFFEILKIDLLENFFTAIIFEIIGFAILACLVLVLGFLPRSWLAASLMAWLKLFIICGVLAISITVKLWRIARAISSAIR